MEDTKNYFDESIAGSNIPLNNSKNEDPTLKKPHFVSMKIILALVLILFVLGSIIVIYEAKNLNMDSSNIDQNLEQEINEIVESSQSTQTIPIEESSQATDSRKWLVY